MAAISGDGGARILVVDDVPENVRLLEAVLAPHVTTSSQPATRSRWAISLVDDSHGGARVVVPACDALTLSACRR